MKDEKSKLNETQTPTCHTRWEAFEEMGLVPTQITCQDYHPAQRVDTSCHSHCLLNVKSVMGHMAPEHEAGGGFAITLAKGVKGAQIWKDLKSEGVELHDFRCDVCDQEVPLVGRRIMKHFEPHSGKVRAPRPGGVFLATLKFSPPDEVDGDEA